MKTTPEKWDEVRESFKKSIMVKTSLASLAQNLEGPDWPVEDKDETPAKYIGMSFEDLLASPGINEDGERVDLLVHILEETLAFDDPFGDMVQDVETASERDNELLKNISKLGIPEDYPIYLTNLAPETIEFCRNEDISDIGSFARFSQNMAQNIIVGGDFRALLNALSHVDESVVSRYLPFRPGSKGVHLAEAAGLAIAALTEAQLAGLAKHLGVALSKEELAMASGITSDQAEALQVRALARLDQFLKHFTAQKAEYEAAIASGSTVERLVMSLNNKLREGVAAGLLARRLEGAVKPKAASSGIAGFFRRLFGGS